MIKTPKELKDYCIVCNEVARRKDLSAKAKGIYYYLATLPKEWQLSQQELFKHFSDGITALRSGFKELVKAGYVIERENRDSKGRLHGKDYEVLWSTEVTETPISDNPNLDNPNLDNINLLNTNKKIITERVNTENNNTKKDTKVSSKSFKKFTFEEFVDETNQFKNKYPKAMITEFLEYWSEPDPNGRMRFQLQKTWKTSGRLATWYRNYKKNNPHLSGVLR